MQKNLYLNYIDAVVAANDYASANNCIFGGEIKVTSNTKFDYIDRSARNLVWSGETSGIFVIDIETFKLKALFAYWEQ